MVAKNKSTFTSNINLNIIQIFYIFFFPKLPKVTITYKLLNALLYLHMNVFIFEKQDGRQTNVHWVFKQYS